MGGERHFKFFLHFKCLCSRIFFRKNGLEIYFLWSVVLFLFFCLIASQAGFFSWQETES